MPINMNSLFEYMIPALSFLFLGVFVFNKDINILESLKKIDSAQAKRLGYVLLFISYFFDFIKLLEFSALNSIVSFTSYLKYLAVFCFLFSKSRRLYFLSVLVYVQLIFTTLKTGVFIDFIIWGTFLFFFITLSFKLSFLIRIALFLTAIPIIVTIQSVKDDYRKATWKGNKEAGLGLFTELAEKNNKANSDEPFEESEGVIRTIARLNQGWHLGLTLRRVPKREPFANGSEMLSDIGASIVPRFFFQNKKVVHTKEKFYKYTGHKIGRNTAMTIGILGDFYINFGREGSFVMLFVFGALISIVIRSFIRKFVIQDPLNIIWLPFLLSYLVRADNDFYIFFNCVVKGFIIFLVVNYIRYKLVEPKLIRSELKTV